MMKALVYLAALTAALPAMAQESNELSQRAFMIGRLAGQLGNAEIKTDGLQAALIQAQKEVEDWKAAFHAWCGSAPNCGRPDK